MEPCGLCTHPQPIASVSLIPQSLHLQMKNLVFYRHLKKPRTRRKVLAALHQGHVPRLCPEGFWRMCVIRPFVALCWGTGAVLTCRLMLEGQISSDFLCIWCSGLNW